MFETKTDATREPGDSRIVRMCEVAQSDQFRARVSSIAGYDATRAGDIRYDGTR